MIKRTRTKLVVLALAACATGISNVRAQGSLTPPGVPSATMKSLQELWDRMQTLESNVNARVGSVESQTLYGQAATIAMLADLARTHGMTVTATRVWQIQTVDNSTRMGTYTSLAFTPSGRPAISYRDDSNNDLKYAECTAVLIGP